MKVHAAALGFLALFATLGLVAAQNPPTREPDPAKPGEQAATSQEREPDVRAITDLLASFVKTYNSKDPKALGACSRRRPRSRTRTAISRGAETPSSPASPRPSLGARLAPLP